MSRLFVIAFVVIAMFVAGCSQHASPSPKQQAAQRQARLEAQARDKLSMYQRLVKLKNYTLAVSIGEEIEQTYPHTKAAATVRESLPEVKAEGKATDEKRRLANAWSYQTAPMDGGTQSTAAIESNPPTGAGQVRLILRRHSKWGQSVYLYAQDDSGFVCKGRCNIVMHVDGKRHVFKGYKPNGKRPAMFIADDKRFIRMLTGAKKITMQVKLKTQGKETLTYDVGGFVPKNWEPLKKGG